MVEKRSLLNFPLIKPFIEINFPFTSQPQSPCHNHSCQNESECVPDFEENTYRCKCHPGFVGLHCERKGMVRYILH